MVSTSENPPGTFKPGKIIKTVVFLFITGACTLLALQPELRLAVPLLIGSTAAMAIISVTTVYLSQQRKIVWSASFIMATALLLRVMFVTAEPQLSDDIYRYIWDGSNILQGVNPYSAAPSAVKPSGGTAAIHSHINHPQYITIYPPGAQIFFAAGAAAGSSTTGFKTLLVLLDLSLCWILIMLLKKLEMPIYLALLYAWNPLPVLEIAASGHIDGAGLLMLGCSIYLIITTRLSKSGTGHNRLTILLAGVLLASAGLVKLFPFVFAPLLFLLVPCGSRRYFSAGFAAALTLLIVPFLPQLTNMFSSLDTYARNWEFAGFAFSTLRRLTGSGLTARIILAGAFLLTVSVILLRFARSIKQCETPLQEATECLKACYSVTMALLMLTPTLQPWYALTLALFLPFCAGSAGLVLCWVVFLTYQVQIPYFILGQWLENPLVTAAVFMAPVTAYILSRLFSNTFPPDTSAHLQ
jgi:hypothetical protein